MFEDDDAAEGEADDGSEGGEEEFVGAEMKLVGEDGGEGEQDCEDVEAERGADRGSEIASQAELEQKGGEPDGGDDDDGERAGECGSAGVENDDGESEEKKSGSDEAPAAGFGG